MGSKWQTIKQNLSIAPKHKQLATSFARSATFFGLAGFLALVYFTDWGVVISHVPIYRSKLDKDETTR